MGTHQRLQQQSIKERSFQEFPLEQQVFEPPPGQRCAGRNYQDRRCCTPEQPCGYEKVIVMDHLTEDPMMVMMVVLVTWCVGLTTVSSLEHIIIPRMTVATCPRQFKISIQ